MCVHIRLSQLMVDKQNRIIYSIALLMNILFSLITSIVEKAVLSVGFTDCKEKKSKRIRLVFQSFCIFAVTISSIGKKINFHRLLHSHLSCK